MTADSFFEVHSRLFEHPALVHGQSDFPIWKLKILDFEMSTISRGLVKLSNILSFFFLVAVSLVLTLIVRLSPLCLSSECFKLPPTLMTLLRSV